MSKKIVLALGGNALGDDLAGQMKTIKITSQVIVDLITQGHEVIVTHGNGPQVGMINQAFEAAVKTEAHSPMLPMSAYVTLNRGYIGYNLQNALEEELLSWDVDEPVATLVIQVEVGANDPAFFNPIKPIGSFFTKQETEQLTKQGYTLKEGAGRGYYHVVTSPKPADTIGRETVKVLVDVDQVAITANGSDIPVIREGNHLRGANTVIDKDWASVRLAEMINTDILIILTAVERVAINFGKENEQWLDRLSLDDAERFIEEGRFARGSMLPKVEAATPFARSRADRETLVTILSRAKGGIRSKIGTVICQRF